MSKKYEIERKITIYKDVISFKYSKIKPDSLYNLYENSNDIYTDVTVDYDRKEFERDFNGLIGYMHLKTLLEKNEAISLDEDFN